MKAALFCIFALFVINAHASPWGTSRLHSSRLVARAAPDARTVMVARAAPVARKVARALFRADDAVARELLRDDASAFVGPLPSYPDILEEANEEPIEEANEEVEAVNRYWGARIKYQ